MDSDKRYLKNLKKQIKYAKNIIIENPGEIVEIIKGKKLTDFYILTQDGYKKEGEMICPEPACAIEEIWMEFQGKEMRIFIDKETGKLRVYTD